MKKDTQSLYSDSLTLTLTCVKMNFATITQSLNYRLHSRATHSAVMQFEGMDSDRNYDSCSCSREGESSSSYTKNIW